MTTSYTVRVEPVGADVQCRADQTILDACLREGVWLPHACTHGTCGTCKATLLGGEVDYGAASPYALLDSEREEGALLLCTAKPKSDVVVEGDVDVEEGVEIHPVRDFTGTVTTLEDIAPQVRRLVIALDTPMTFNAGQYVLLKTPSGEQRPFSIASPTTRGDQIELHIKRYDTGVCSGQWVFKYLACGDGVALSGPYGRFFLRPARLEPILLLGSGTGLAPLKAIVLEVLERHLDRRVVLYHGVRALADLYDRDFFRTLSEEHAWFDYRPALSRDDWVGRRGRVPALLAADFPRAAGHVAYVCGSPEMVADTMKTLMRARLFPRDIYREDFFDALAKQAGALALRGPLLRR